MRQKHGRSPHKRGKRDARLSEGSDIERLLPCQFAIVTKREGKAKNIIHHGIGERNKTNWRKTETTEKKREEKKSIEFEHYTEEENV